MALPHYPNINHFFLKVVYDRFQGMFSRVNEVCFPLIKVQYKYIELGVTAAAHHIFALKKDYY